MATPDIEFKSIRLHRGSQSNAFEELCCQLAGDHAAAAGRTFIRKGPGADAGLEAFSIDAKGDEVGWQVKYYWDMASGLTSLTDSLTQALSKHLRLVRFIACLPMDLSDSRKTGVKTALAKWDAWEKAQIAAAAAAGRTIVIERWDAHALKDRLTADPKAAGRISFWFDQTFFDTAWFKERFETAVANLGSRYTAETHLGLPLRRSILAVARDPAFGQELEAHHDRTADIRSRPPQDASAPAVAGRAAVDDLIGRLHAASKLTLDDYPVDDLRQAAVGARTGVSDWLLDLRKLDPRLENEATRALRAMLSTLDEVVRQLQADRWSLINTRRLLVYGDGGRGKSHLLADACAHQLARGYPALLIPSNILEVKEPLGQIVNLLDLPTHVRRSEFLSALNTAAMASGVRALFVIDGINERDGQTLWSTHLAAFLVEVERHPWVSVVLSCRTTFLEGAIPVSVTEDRLPRLEHEGFSSADAERYLEMRGISSPEAPWPLEEFRTPLFLKTLCDGLQLNGQTTLPRGSSGLTEIFAVYRQAVVDSLARDMKLTRALAEVDRAIDAIAGEIAATGDPSVPYLRAHQLVSAILPGRGTVDSDLLFQLIASGMLSTDRIGSDEFVRFTFERYNDHAVARGLLEASVQGGDVVAAASGSTPLNAVLHTRRPRLGVLEALAVQLPESWGVELPDLPTGGATNYAIQQAFIVSLTTRATSAFTPRTWDLVDEEGGLELELETLIRLSTEDEARADALHDRLAAQSMPVRDAQWSVHVGRNSEATKYLIDWALQTDATRISADRVVHAARTLTWVLSTTNREHRDRATKALVNLFADHPAAIAPVLDRFIGVDDLYVLERLICAVYGAALQGRWPAAAAVAVVTDVNARLFASGPPPVNVLVRDHGRNLIDWALNAGVLSPNFDPRPSRPPYASAWPIRFVSDAIIDSFTQTYGTGYVGRDQIVASCVENGDFARYVLDGAVDDWSPALRGTSPLPTREEVHDQWVSRFQAAATPPQTAAYDVLVQVVESMPSGWPGQEDKARLKAAKAAFAATVSSDVYESWRAEAEHWRKDGNMYQRPAPRDRAEFNLAWARRWVCWRAHDLGWSDVLHQYFDNHVNNDRMSHGLERVGKKYQWLALYELRARMADNLQPVEASLDAEPEDLRNLDPSLLAGALPEDEDDDRRLDALLNEHGRAPSIILAPVTVDEALVWRDLSDDLPDTREDVNRLVDGEPWLTLKGFQTWRGGPDSLQRQISRWITCVITDRSTRAAFVAMAVRQPRFDHDGIGDNDRVPWRSYLGEHPWRWGHGAGDDGWQQDWRPRQGRPPTPNFRLRLTTTAYLAEAGGYDHSIRQNFDTRLPEAWLIDALDLRLTNGRDTAYSNPAGRILYRDETPVGGGETTAVIAGDAFLDMLARNDLSAVWLINGEKNVYGGSRSDAFGGRRYYSRVIWSDGTDLQMEPRGSELSPPDASQLAALRAANH